MSESMNEKERKKLLSEIAKPRPRMVPVTFTVPPAVKEFIFAAARAEGVSHSEMYRRALYVGVEMIGNAADESDEEWV